MQSVESKTLPWLPPYVSLEERAVKQLRIEVKSADKTVLIVPKGTPISAARAFYAQHHEWIETQRVRLAHNASFDFGLHGQQWLLHGKPHTEDTRPDDLAAWYRQYANQYLPKQLSHLAKTYGFTFAKCTIRDQKTRWGSCSHQGNISLNWRLILMPVWVSDYVLIHELCHTREMNHSAAFWQEVATCHLQVADARQWLKEAGSAILCL